MSTKSKLLAMTENLELPAEGKDSEAVHRSPERTPDADSASSDPQAQLRFPPVAVGSGARTGPGQMLQFRGQIMAAEGELGKLRDRLKEHEGSTPTRNLDPSTVVPSRWANRHPKSFNTPEFARLKQDIELAGGNIQPIKVRVLKDHPGRYELIFGHRRHRACSELGLPVGATIETGAVSDLELFSAMDRENRERADLSPYEQGAMYRRALEEGLYPSNRKLSAALGVSHTWVNAVLMVADLPMPVVECFKSPLDIQHRHAKLLSTALETDRKGILRRAEKLRAQERPSSAQAVVNALIGQAPDVAGTQRSIVVEGKPAGHWKRGRAGALTIQIDAAFLPGDRHLEVLNSIAAALKK